MSVYLSVAPGAGPAGCYGGFKLLSYLVILAVLDGCCIALFCFFAGVGEGLVADRRRGDGMNAVSNECIYRSICSEGCSLCVPRSCGRLGPHSPFPAQSPLHTHPAFRYHPRSPAQLFAQPSSCHAIPFRAMAMIAASTVVPRCSCCRARHGPRASAKRVCSGELLYPSRRPSLTSHPACFAPAGVCGGFEFWGRGRGPTAGVTVGKMTALIGRECKGGRFLLKDETYLHVIPGWRMILLFTRKDVHS